VSLVDSASTLPSWNDPDTCIPTDTGHGLDTG